MTSSRVLLAALAVLGVLLLAAGCGGEESVPADAVAVVDGESIPKAELDGLLARAKKGYQQQKREFPKAGTPEYQSLQTQAVAYLVQRKEYELAADELGVQVTDAEVDKRVTEIKKQYFGGDDKRYQTQLKEQGYTPATFEADVRAQVLSEKLYERVTKDAKVADADVAAYYEQNKQQYVVPESRDVRHILVKTKAQADAIYAQLEDGADFAALAKQKSLDPGSKDQGGKLTISKGQTVPQFDQTAFLLDQGVVSKPVKTQFGYHLIEPLSAVKPGRTTPLAQVKDQIAEQLRNEKRNELLTKWTEELKEKYEGEIAYAEGFAPPAEATESVSTAGETTGGETTEK